MKTVLLASARMAVLFDQFSEDRARREVKMQAQDMAELVALKRELEEVRARKSYIYRAWQVITRFVLHSLIASSLPLFPLSLSNHTLSMILSICHMHTHSLIHLFRLFSFLSVICLHLTSAIGRYVLVYKTHAYPRNGGLIFRFLMTAHSHMLFYIRIKTFRDFSLLHSLSTLTTYLPLSPSLSLSPFSIQSCALKNSAIDGFGHSQLVFLH